MNNCNTIYYDRLPRLPSPYRSRYCNLLLNYITFTYHNNPSTFPSPPSRIRDLGIKGWFDWWARRFDWGFDWIFEWGIDWGIVLLVWVSWIGLTGGRGGLTGGLAGVLTGVLTGELFSWFGYHGSRRQ